MKRKKIFPQRFCLFVSVLSLQPLYFNYGEVKKLIASEKKENFMTEVLHLGNEGSDFTASDDQIFAFINNITFDSNGSFIVADTKMRNLRKFSRTGKLMWEFFKDGRGPGEIGAATLVKSLGNQIFVYDLVNRKIIRYNSDMVFEKEFIVPRAILGMTVSEHGDIYASGVSYKQDLFQTEHILMFDKDGKTKNSFGKEIRLDLKHIKGRNKWLVYTYYAGWIGLSLWNDKLLASPIFDGNTFVYSLEGELLYHFQNTEFNYKLLNYTVRERSVKYTTYETRAGTAIGLSNKHILKGYQVSEKKGMIEFYLDIFEGNGNIVKSQIPVNGMLMDVSREGLLICSSFHPFPQIWVYRLDFTQLQR